MITPTAPFIQAAHIRGWETIAAYHQSPGGLTRSTNSCLATTSITLLGCQQEGKWLIPEVRIRADQNTSWSAIMLGRFRMSVDDAINSFISIISHVFSQPRLSHQMSRFTFIERAKYSIEEAREVHERLGMQYQRRWERGDTKDAFDGKDLLFGQPRFGTRT